MNDQIKDGGPAFPADELHDQTPPYRHLLASQGMSLRDYFAAKAMQGFCANGPENFEDMEQVAEQSYELADYMISQRERQS